MDTDRLREFVAVVDAGSVTKAAETLWMTQPTLSKHLVELEGRFGTQLLERFSGGVRATAAGNLLYRESTDLLERENRLTEQMERMRGVAMRTVSVACYVDYGPTDDAVALAVDEAAPLCPGATVGVVDLCQYQGDCLAGLKAGQLDMVVSATAQGADYTGLVRRRIMEDRVALITRADSRLAGRGRVSVADLAGEVIWLSATPTFPLMDLFGEVLDACGLPYTRYVSEAAPGNSSVTALNVGEGGYALFFRSMFGHLVPRAKRADYAVLEVDDPRFTVGVDLVYRDDGDPVVATLAEIIARQAAGIDPRDYD